jgi:DNA-binding NarL/FixJ family response regulator
MKIVIIDDHPLVRHGLVALLSHQSGIDVVGEGGSVEEGVNIIKKTSPDLSLLDLRLGNKSGLDIVSRMNSEKDRCKFVILTSYADEGSFRKAEELKVDGYILKEAFPEEIVHAIQIVGRGRKYYDPGMMEMMMKPGDSELEEKLTTREKDVLIALGKGYSNHQIASNLFITEFTVKKHVSQVLAKLNLADRTQAALYANNKGLVKFQ